MLICLQVFYKPSSRSGANCRWRYKPQKTAFDGLDILTLRAMRAWSIPPSAWDDLPSEDQIIMTAYEQWRFDTLNNQLEKMREHEANTPEAVATLLGEMI